LSGILRFAALLLTISATLHAGAAAGATNVALASAGAVASASSTLAGYPVAAVNNGDRTGAGNAFWADDSANIPDDFVQIVFNGTKTIDRVVVYSVQDAYTSPVEPTDAMTFSLYGLEALKVEGWNGSAWVLLDAVLFNNLVKRTFTFSPFTTDRIRVTVGNPLAAYSRIVEIEAFYTAAGPPLATPTVALASSLSPSTSGQLVSFTATVSGSRGTPTGTVNFQVGGVTIAGCSGRALVAGVAACATSALSVATHSITAAYSGDGTYTSGTSSAVSQDVYPLGVSNVALASAGAVPSASSTNPAYPVSAVNNGIRTGGNDGFFADFTLDAYPDWVQIDFNGAKTIDRVVVYSVQDARTTPVEPTDSMTCLIYCLVDFTVEGWDGSAWVTLGTVTGNNLVKRNVAFSAFTTDRIRVNVNAARQYYSMVVEIEAFGTATGPPPPGTSTVMLESSANPSAWGEFVYFTATVSGPSGTPTGTVSFRDGGGALIGCTARSLSAGVAVCSAYSLSVTTHPITADYSGDGTYSPGTSNTIIQVVNAGAPGPNVALASAGAVATASSTQPGYAVSAVNDGSRSGTGGALWTDNTFGAFPDWVQINFNGTQRIDRVVVYSAQDAYTSPVEPTDAMTFSLYGLVHFTVEGWNGSAWVTLGTVTGNNLVARTVTFATFFTDRIRVNVTSALDAYSRIVEIEAFGTSTAPRPNVWLVPSPIPSISGQAVSLSAYANGSSGTPTGTFDFRDGGVTIAGCSAVALVAGSATCNTSFHPAGIHTLTAIYSGDATYVTGTTSPLDFIVNAAPAGGANVALASAGAVASASSTLSGYPVSAVNNGNRTGAGNAFWADGTVSTFPDSVQIVFNGSQTIDRVIVYSVQDGYVNPFEPTDAMTFSLYGLVDFTVQGWNGSAWVTLGTVTGNNLVKRTVTFAAFTTDRIRVNVTNALAAYSRIVEIEAFGTAAGLPPATPTVALASSLNPSTSGQLVTFTATVSGSSGTPAGSVNFRDGGVSISGCAAQALSAGVATCATSVLSAATHPITAAYSGDGTYATGTSGTVNQVVNAAASSGTNVALASVGAVASASSTLSGYPVSAVNNGDRKGAGNTFWADGTVSTFPDSVQIVFNGTKTIDSVVVYSIQDAYTIPAEPTDAMTFSLYGVVAFTVEGWNGSAWVNLGTVTGNNLVKRTVTFSGYTTDRIRVNVTNALAAYSRIVEIEAFGIDAGPPPPLATPTVTLVSSLNPSTSGQSVTFTATASGSSGTPTGTVDFRDGGVSIAGCGAQALSAGVAICATSALTVATHSITAIYSGDSAYSGGTSGFLNQVVDVPAGNPPAGYGNVALLSAGAVAYASSSHPSYPVTLLIDGDRTGAGGAFWADNTPGDFPEFVQIVFNGSKTIDRVVVYSVQDNYANPIEPTDSTTFSPSLYGLRDLTVEGAFNELLGTATGNTLVKRTFTFSPHITDRIMVIVNAANGYSRIVEIEAFGTDNGPPLATPTVGLSSSLSPSTNGQSVTFTAAVSGDSGTPTGFVDFRDGGLSIGGCSSVALSAGSANCSTSALTTGTHPITAVYFGNSTYASVSSGVLRQVVNHPADYGNVALASAGAVASASSTLAGYPVAAVNDGDRTGAASTFWANATPGAMPGTFPDYVQINFNGVKTIDHVIVYSVQDNYASPLEPTDTTTFSPSLFGLNSFTVYAWSGLAWVNVAAVINNNLVKRTVTFDPFTTDRIRVYVIDESDYSRIVEIEAFGYAGPSPTNVALASAGAAATASSTLTGYSVAAVNDGDRTGTGATFWADGTTSIFPDSVQVLFSGTKTIDRIVVHSVQDAYTSPVEPTDAMTFSLYGLVDFTVEGWNGSAWVTLGTVTGNNLVKRTVTFAAFTTDRIRVNFTNALAAYSRVVEIEAWGN